MPVRGYTVPPEAQPHPSGLRPDVRIRGVRELGWVAAGLVALDGVLALGVFVVALATDLEALLANDAVAIAFGIVVVLVAIASAVVLIVWLYRCRKNLDAFESAYPRWGAGWTIGAWFIPIANLVLVPLVFADVARNSARTAERASRLVAVVWVWAVAQIVSSCSDRLIGAGIGIPGFTTPSVPGALGISTGAAFFSVVLVTVMTAAQAAAILMTTHEQHARLSGAPFSASPGASPGVSVAGS